MYTSNSSGYNPAAFNLDESLSIRSPYGSGRSLCDTICMYMHVCMHACMHVYMNIYLKLQGIKPSRVQSGRRLVH